MQDTTLKGIIQEAGSRSKILAQDRYVDTKEELLRVVEKLRAVGIHIVLTQGTFDLFHIGHGRYLRKAREHGDVLIVGVDDDIKARERKGENRPVVPFEERMEILTLPQLADIVTIKRHDDPKWHLIKLIHPDVLIAVDGTYTPDEIVALQEHCGEVVVLERQAATSTSAKIRKLVLDGADVLSQVLSETLPEKITELLKQSLPVLLKDAYQKMREGGG